MSMILDNSVSMAWCFEDEESPYSEAALESLSAGQAHVPAIWPLEVLNTLLAAERRHRISAAKSLAFVRLLARMPIHIAGDVREPTQSRTLEIGRALNLSAYDTIGHGRPL